MFKPVLRCIGANGVARSVAENLACDANVFILNHSKPTFLLFGIANGHEEVEVSHRQRFLVMDRCGYWRVNDFKNC